jgi:hypothetical protein
VYKRYGETLIEFESRRNKFLKSAYAKVNDHKSFIKTKGELDTCNNCYSYIIRPDEKTLITSVTNENLISADWVFNHLEINLLNDAKIIADDRGIQRLFKIKAENYVGSYTYTISLGGESFLHRNF